MLLALVLLVAAYFLAPLRTNVLILGIDPRDDSDLGRTDINIMLTVIPLKPYVGMLSIPRDLWLPIPGHGENRINTAHFFAEIDNPGSGPATTAQVIHDNFGVTLPYYVRVRFDGFKGLINAMGGVTVDLPTDMNGLEAGEHHLDGDEALAFVRNRTGSDDFFRMQHTQLLMISAAKQMINPTFWPRIPDVLTASKAFIDTNLPVWQWPRLGLAVLRAGSKGVDNRTITRDMVTPFITDGGADVLRPNWDQIHPVVKEMFGN